jgi:hypothetical protein
MLVTTWWRFARVASRALLVATAVGGCEIAIGSEVPIFECVGGVATCPGNQVCDPNSHQCIPSCVVAGCSPGLQCDWKAGLCSSPSATDGDDGTVSADGNADATLAEVGPGEGASWSDGAYGDVNDASEAGEAAWPVDAGGDSACRGLMCPCTDGASCDSGICADSLTVTSALYAAAGNQNFCTTPCCTSTDCPFGTVCFASAAGGNYCVNPAWLLRSTMPGNVMGGGTCVMGFDCRSGLCSGSDGGYGVCLDTCCATSPRTVTTNECATNTTCRFGMFPGAVEFDRGYAAFCGRAFGPAGPNAAPCMSPYQCMSGLCDYAYCENACRSTADCTAYGQSCTYSNPPAPNGSAVIAVCSAAPGALPGAGVEGSWCTSNANCQSQFCDATSHQCTDVCFTDADCTQSGWRCRPEQVKQEAGTISVLACGP